MQRNTGKILFYEKNFLEKMFFLGRDRVQKIAKSLISKGIPRLLDRRSREIYTWEGTRRTFRKMQLLRKDKGIFGRFFKYNRFLTMIYSIFYL